MFSSLMHYFFPTLKPQELRKFIWLGIIAFVMIGAYWLMWLLKQAIFFKVAFPQSLGWAPEQGSLFQPVAKTWSPFVVLGVVLLYSKLVDLVKKHQLFYIICSFYALLFACLSMLIFVKEMYGPEALGKTTLAALGWVNFFATESFGSLLVALFWSFANSITDSESAQRGFPLIMVFAQLGAMCGASTLFFAKSVGVIWPFLFICSILITLIMILIFYFMRLMPASQLIGNKAAHATEKMHESFIEGFFSGLVLLVSKPYLLGVLIISTFGDIALQIVEYLMHRQASISCDYASETAFCWFQGLFGVMTNGLAFFIALFGTGYLIKRLGMRNSLLLYPMIFACVLTLLFGFFFVGNPTNTQLLWSTFTTLMIFKALSYAFNNPVKEIMYIPTSKDAKFKSKGWIDMFGSRFAKASGAQITGAYSHSLEGLMFFGALISFGLIGAWIFAAFYVGKKNQQLVKSGKIIE